jgi:phosphoglycolate phosphatase-like HAD superfamily hydrolase
MRKIKIFDYDGVLVDSKEAHWQFYSGVGNEKGLSLKRSSFDKAIANPTIYFWKNLGIPEKYVEEIEKRYLEEYSEFEIKPFEGVVDILEELSERGDILTLATLCRRPLVERHFGTHLHFFERHFCLDDCDASRRSFSKDILFSKLFDIYGSNPTNFLFFGDTSWDLDTAQTLEVGFVGVNYGWGNFPENSGFPLVRNVRELRNFLIERG